MSYWTLIRDERLPGDVSGDLDMDELAAVLRFLDDDGDTTSSVVVQPEISDTDLSS